MMTVTEADILALAPKARREYVTAILGKLSQMRAAGILENERRWCHFIAQCAHETGGFTILREILHYTSAARLRKVWPARFRSKSDRELAPLLRNPIALGDAVYNGRMGNVAPGDGCAYRGGGLLQCTGRAAVAKYAKSLGLDPTPALLDDVMVTTEFAILEWSEAKCNKWADENDIVAVSKAINTGSAASGVRPVGIDDRKRWFAKAWSIWGDKGKPDVPVAKATLLDTSKLVAKVALVAEGTRQAAITVAEAPIPPVPEIATKSLENANAWKKLGSGIWALGGEIAGVVGMAGKLWPFAAIVVVSGGVWAFLRWGR